MPPRGRPKKVGLKRMDAAVENMRVLGFSDELVRSTVKRLLEVYDGDSGWLFIEEGSYKLLIDTILDEQDNDLLKGDSSEGNVRDNNDTSSAAMLLTGVEDAVSQTNEIVNRTTKIYFYDENAFGLKQSREERIQQSVSLLTTPAFLTAGGEDCDPPPAEAERTDERDISLEENLFHSPPPLISSSPPVEGLVKQRRRRFRGWISDDEPNDIDTVLLIPATKMQLERLILGMDEHSVSRWDEKPE